MRVTVLATRLDLADSPGYVRRDAGAGTAPCPSGQPGSGTTGTSSGTVLLVATNLRLRPEVAQALRAAAERSGRSQQDLLREAVERYLGLAPEQSELDRAIAEGLVRPPTPFRDVHPRATLPEGVTTLDLLDRDER